MDLRSLTRLETPRGSLPLPAFLPDATRAVVRTLDSGDVESCGIKALMVNALHLSDSPGVTLVKQAGGIHHFMGWNGPVASDSGGFQVLSLLADRPSAGNVSGKGIRYRPPGARKQTVWGPDRCIQQQLALGADILFCLDHCTHPGQPAEMQTQSVAHTVEWSKACRESFDRRTETVDESSRPKLFAVVQGGEDPDLRRRCADALIDIGFDGYGYGGWPVSDDGGLTDSVGLVSELVPEDVPRHGLGIGKPENLVRAHRLGYDTFDCVLPTRDARRKRLFVASSDLASASLSNSDFYRYLYITDERFARDTSPVDPLCGCQCCRSYSRSYLHHLLKIGDSAALRLATIHNLSFYSKLMARLQDDRRAVVNPT